MTHPEVKKHGTYHSIDVFLKEKEKENITEMFIGRFESDKKYHLLGYRPKNMEHLFPEKTELDQDLGIVQSPNKKINLAHLVAGEKIIIKPEKESSYKATIVRLNNSTTSAYRT